MVDGDHGSHSYLRTIELGPELTMWGVEPIAIVPQEVSLEVRVVADPERRLRRQVGVPPEEAVLIADRYGIWDDSSATDRTV